MPSSAPPDIYSLSLHDALPIFAPCGSILVRRFTLMSRFIIIFVAAALSLPSLALAKRVAQAEVKPVVYQGVRYIAPNDDGRRAYRSEEHTSELQSHHDLVCRLLPPPTSTLFPYTTLFRSSHPAAPFSLGASHLCHDSSSFLSPRRCRCRVWRLPSVSLKQRSSLWSIRAFDTSLRMTMVVAPTDRKSTRLNSSHITISYAVFCPPRHLLSFPTRRSSDLRTLRLHSR